MARKFTSAVLTTLAVAGMVVPALALAQPRQGTGNTNRNTPAERCAPVGTTPTGGLKPCRVPSQTPPDVPPTNGFLPLLGPMLVASGMTGAVASGLQGGPASP